MSSDAPRAITDDLDLGAEPPARAGVPWSTVAKVTAVVVALYLLVAGVYLWSARSDVLSGRDALVSLASTDPLSTDLEELKSELVAAQGPVASGSSKLQSPLLWPLRPLPVVGRHLASARSLTKVAEAAVDDTIVVVDAAAVLETAEPEDRVADLVSLEAALGELNASLTDADLGPDNNLVGPLASARNEAATQLADLETQAAEAEIVVRGLRSFLDQSSYLMMAANINEMQVGGGTPLSLGTVAIENSDFSVSSFQTIEDLEIEGGLPAVDDDVAELWGFLSPTNDFKKLMLSPRFREFGGPQSLVLYESVTGETPQGTITLDPVALQALLAVVGPITVDDQEFSADNILRYIFVDQYDEFLTGDEVNLDNLSTLGPGQDARRDRLAEVAALTVDAMANKPWEPLDLINAFRPVAAGRHLLAYSTVAEEQAMWEELGIAGAVSGNEVGVALLNIGVNKLDPFVDVDVVVSEGPVDRADPDAERTFDLEVIITNNGTTTLPTAVTGYYWEALELPTEASYLGRLMFLMPAGTTQLEVVDPDLQVEVFGRDGPLAVLVARLDPIPEGEQYVVRARARVEPSAESYQVLPSGRYIPIDYTWNGAQFTDAVGATVEAD